MIFTAGTERFRRTERGDVSFSVRYLSADQMVEVINSLYGTAQAYQPSSIKPRLTVCATIPFRPEQPNRYLELEAKKFGTVNDWQVTIYICTKNNNEQLIPRAAEAVKTGLKGYFKKIGYEVF